LITPEIIIEDTSKPQGNPEVSEIVEDPSEPQGNP